MAPVVHCVRHAQGYHNLSPNNHHILDPLLTPLGEEQCATLRQTFPYHEKISLIISSPLRRTLHTAFLAFSPSLANGHCRYDIQALPEIQEISDLPCDTGSDPESLRIEMKESRLPVDLSLVQSGWNVKTLDNRWAASREALTQRAAESRRFIRDRIIDLQRRSGEAEPHVVVVTHGGFLHYLTQDWEDRSTYHGTGWTNTEYRSFHFADLDGTRPSTCNITTTVNHLKNKSSSPPHHDPDAYKNATLVEAPESRARRGRTVPPAVAELFATRIGCLVGEEDDDDDEVGDADEDGDTALARVLTQDENTHTRGGEVPATATAAVTLGERRNSNVRERRGVASAAAAAA